MNNNLKIIKWGGIFGLAGCILFFGVSVIAEQLFWQKQQLNTTQAFLAVTGTSPGYQITTATHLLIALAMLCFIIAFIGLKRFLETNICGNKITVGTIFGIIACSIMVEMSIIQGTVMAELGRMFLQAKNDVDKQIVVALYRGLRRIDYALDISFDMFFFISWILLGLVMFNHKNFGRVFGTMGILLFGTVTILNALSAPNAPGIELAPITVLWIAAVYIQMIRTSGKLIFENKQNMLS